MRSVGQRKFVLGGIAEAGAATARAFAQSRHGDHGGLYESLQSPRRTGPPDLAARQRSFDEAFSIA
jgi:hypothetical protein